MHILHFFPHPSFFLTLPARPVITILINYAAYLTFPHLPKQIITCVLIENSFDILNFLALIIENFDKKEFFKNINFTVSSGRTIINNKMLG